MKLLGSSENKKQNKDKNSKNPTHLEITEVVLVHCNIVNNDYQQDSRYLYIFVDNLVEIAPTNFIPIFNSQFSYIEVWFTDQNSQPLEIEDRINLTLVIKFYSYYKNALFN